MSAHSRFLYNGRFSAPFSRKTPFDRDTKLELALARPADLPARKLRRRRQTADLLREHVYKTGNSRRRHSAEPESSV